MDYDDYAALLEASTADLNLSAEAAADGDASSWELDHLLNQAQEAERQCIDAELGAIDRQMRERTALHDEIVHELEHDCEQYEERLAQLITQFISQGRKMHQQARISIHPVFNSCSSSAHIYIRIFYMCAREKSSSMNTHYDLVSRNLEEIVTEEELGSVLNEGDPSAYIGYAPTGRMHIGHFTTIRKVADLVEAGVDVTILIADFHAYLDDNKTPWDLLEDRSEYYQLAIQKMLEVAGCALDDVTFVKGSEYQKEPGYFIELLQMAGECTATRAQRAGTDVVRENQNPRLGSLIYPLMQTLDVKYLDADIVYGGVDQRGIYMFSREILSEFGYEKPICLFAPLLSGLDGGKMSASVPSSKISLTDKPEEIREKVNEAYCPAEETDENGVLEYVELLLFPLLEAKDQPFAVERDDEYGDDLVYETYEELEENFVSGELHPLDLKNAVAGYLEEVLSEIRIELTEKRNVMQRAYPDEF